MVGDHAAPRAEVQAHFEAVLLSVIAADEKLFEAIAAAHSRSTRDRRVMSLTGEWFKEDWPDEHSSHESWKQSPLVMEARRLRNQAAHRYMNKRGGARGWEVEGMTNSEMPSQPSRDLHGFASELVIHSETLVQIVNTIGNLPVEPEEDRFLRDSLKGIVT
jgi:hypothetical protein